jgi:type IV pilus assembly protein PilA
MKAKKLGSQGFTLLELAFVIGIIIALVAIFAPLAMDKLAQSRIVKAQADIDAISTALTNFFTDIGSFPSCDAATVCDPNGDSANNLKFLAICAGTGGVATASCAGEYPAETATNWGVLTTQDEASPDRNNFYNHVVINNPNVDGTVGEAGVAKDYKTTKWKGPYITKLGVDPWGNAYIIHIGAIQKTGCPVDAAGAATCGTSGKGWILSAGPDATLQTGPDASALAGDDLGYIFCTSC